MMETRPERIELSWSAGFAALRPTVDMYAPGAVVALWYCPVCREPTHRRYGPGRSRVYCTNACRQRAYRWRRASRERLSPPRRPGRSATRDGVHAERHPADPVGFRRSSSGRQVTACGAFARRASDTPERFAHTTFIPGEDSCRRCCDLLGLRELEPAECRRAATAATTIAARARARARASAPPATAAAAAIRWSRALPSGSVDRRGP